MIVGIGVDLEEVERMKQAIERNGERLIQRVFTAGEIEYVEARANRYERYAARFAAKEAAMKALGTGWTKDIGWRDFEIVNHSNGCPTLKMSGGAARLAEERGCRRVHVSLSHTRNSVIAQVILEG